MAIDRLPSGNFRARLMMDGRRYTATWPTEADARLWELETRAAVAKRRGAGSVTFAAYAQDWLAGFIDDAPDRERFEAALRHRLLPALGEQPLLEVLEPDRNELYRQLPDADGDEGIAAARESVQQIWMLLEDLHVAGHILNGLVHLDRVCLRAGLADVRREVQHPGFVLPHHLDEPLRQLSVCILLPGPDRVRVDVDEGAFPGRLDSLRVGRFLLLLTIIAPRSEGDGTVRPAVLAGRTR